MDECMQHTLMISAFKNLAIFWYFSGIFEFESKNFENIRFHEIS